MFAVATVFLQYVYNSMFINSVEGARPYLMDLVYGVAKPGTLKRELAWKSIGSQ